MSKYFLGSVGSAEAFRITPLGRQLAFVCKTLTDSSINISTTKDDLRGGTGAPIVTNFYHDPNIEITLTDIFWKESYLEAQLGTMFQAGTDVAAYQTETVTASMAGLALKKRALPLNLACDTENSAIAWYAKSGSDEWKAVKTFPGLTPSTSIAYDKSMKVGDTYCVRYLATDEQARDAIITSNIIPEELYLVITTPIFFGDACSTSNGKLAGSLTFEIPRFKLNGAQNFSFNMSSNSTMELSGTALADFSGCDMINGQLLRVIETIEGRTLNDGLIGIIVDAGTGYLKGTNAPLYGIYENGSVGILAHANTNLGQGGTPQPNGNTAISGVWSGTYCTNGIMHFGNAGNYTVTYNTGSSNFATTFTGRE